LGGTSDGTDAFIDPTRGRIVYPRPRRVNVGFPPLMVCGVDAVAMARGSPRQAPVRMWLAGKRKEHARRTACDSAEQEFRVPP